MLGPYKRGKRAGLTGDSLAASLGTPGDLRIVPFRGEYFELRAAARHRVRGMIYPVPDPRFPFLGVHFTRMIHGGVEAGPNAVLAFRREGYRFSSFELRDVMEMARFPGFWRMASKYWRTGLGEMRRSLSKVAFWRALRRLLPALEMDDLHPAGSGVRAQAVEPTGALVDDFRIREAERGIIYDKYSEKENDILTATVHRIDRGNIFVEFGKAEGIIPASETVYTEQYNLGDHMKVYVIEVKKTNKGPQIIVSRTHPYLIKKLFELEVPEIRQGIVQIKSIAREAGQRLDVLRIVLQRLGVGLGRAAGVAEPHRLRGEREQGLDVAGLGRAA